MLCSEPRQGFLFGTDPSPKGKLPITGPGFYAHGQDTALTVQRKPSSAKGMICRAGIPAHVCLGQGDRFRAIT